MDQKDGGTSAMRNLSPSSRFRPLLSVAAGIALLLAVPACGDGDDSNTTVPGAAAQTETTLDRGAALDLSPEESRELASAVSIQLREVPVEYSRGIVQVDDLRTIPDVFPPDGFRELELFWAIGSFDAVERPLPPEFATTLVSAGKDVRTVLAGRDPQSGEFVMVSAMYDDLSEEVTRLATWEVVRLDSSAIELPEGHSTTDG